MPPLPDAGPGAPPPPALPGKQLGVRTQRPRIYKQPGTGPKNPVVLVGLVVVWVLVGFR